MAITFRGCEHLDFEPHYGHCKRQLITCFSETKLCWKRADDGDLVQFCSRRGRVNSPVGHPSQSNAICNDYNETDRTVDVPTDELES